MNVSGAPTRPLPGGIEALRGRSDPEAVRGAAREVEALFAYEMVKAMRASSAGAGGKGFGSEVYGSLFDMELARVIASRGLGLQEVFLKGLVQENTAGESGRIPSREITLPVSPKDPQVAPPEVDLPDPWEPETEGEDPGVLPAESEAVLQATDVPAPAERGTEAPPQTPGAATAVPPAETGPEAAPSPSISPAPSLPPSTPGASFPIRDGGRVSSGFGFRKDPFTGRIALHRGVDIAAPEGTAVYPVRSGEVTFSGRVKGYGNVVVVSHGDGFVTKYAHNRVNRVAVGDPVGPDTVIAEVGSTGRSTGPHLHFEVRYEGQNVRPETVFAGNVKETGG